MARSAPFGLGTTGEEHLGHSPVQPAHLARRPGQPVPPERSVRERNRSRDDRDDEGDRDGDDNSVGRYPRRRLPARWIRRCRTVAPG